MYNVIMHYLKSFLSCSIRNLIMKNYSHRKSSDKIWAQEGRLFRQKAAIFPSFSSVIMNFFSPIGLISFIDPLHKKYQKPNVESCQSTKIFLVTLTFFQDLDNSYYGRHNTKI